MYDPYEHKCKDPDECWFWWVGTWIGAGEDTPELAPEVIRNELFDYHRMLSGLPALYDEITGGRASKPNTNMRAIVELVEERQRELANDYWLEGFEAGKDYCATES